MSFISNFFNDMNNNDSNIDMLTDTVETEHYVLGVDDFLQFEMIAAMMEVTVDYLLDEFESKLQSCRLLHPVRI